MFNGSGESRGRLTGWPIALLRISLGALFLRSAWAKIQAGAQWPDRMVGFLHSVDKGAPEFYRQFVDTVVVPNAPAFAWAVLMGELYVGVALLLGLTTRLASLVGLAMVANFMLAKGNEFWLPTNHDSLFVLILLALMFSGAGRVWGVDKFLARHWPRGPLW